MRVRPLTWFPQTALGSVVVARCEAWYSQGYSTVYSAQPTSKADLASSRHHRKLLSCWCGHLRHRRTRETPRSTAFGGLGAPSGIRRSRAGGATLSIAILVAEPTSRFTMATPRSRHPSVAKSHRRHLSAESQGRGQSVPDDHRHWTPCWKASDTGPRRILVRRRTAIITHREPIRDDGHHAAQRRPLVIHMSSATDLIRYYDMLLNGSGGLPRSEPGSSSRSGPVHPNGRRRLPAALGIPDGLYAETGGVKQGWMCVSEPIG